MKNILEETPQWKKYCDAKPDHSSKHINLISEALVQAYVDLDDALRKSETEVGSVDEFIVRLSKLFIL